MNFRINAAVYTLCRMMPCDERPPINLASEHDFDFFAFAEDRDRYGRARHAVRRDVRRRGRSRERGPLTVECDDNVVGRTPAFLAAACGPNCPTCFTRRRHPSFGTPAACVARRAFRGTSRRWPCGAGPSLRPPREIVLLPPALGSSIDIFLPSLRAAPRPQRGPGSAWCSTHCTSAIDSSGWPCELRESRRPAETPPCSAGESCLDAQHRRPFLRVEDQPERFGMRIGEQQLLRDRLLALAVDAAAGRRRSGGSGCSSAPPCPRSPASGRTCPCSSGILLRRRRTPAPGPCLPASSALFFGILLVQLQRPLQRLGQPLDRDVVGPVGAVRARAEAAVDRAVGVEQEHGERLVVVELEQRQVEAVGRDDADADELVQQRPDALVLVDQVVVELDALLAGDAAEHDQQRLAGLLRLGEALGQVVVDPEAVGLDLLAVVAHLFGRDGF